MERPRVRAARASVATAAVFAACALFLVARADRGRGFHIDEAHKLGESRYFELYFVERDFANPAWTDDFFARTNPPLGKYVFGAAARLAGQPVRDGRYQDAFARLWRRPAALRAEIPDAALRATRTTSALFGAGVAALLFAAARRLGGTLAGVATVAVLLANAAFLDAAGYGLTDTLLLCGLAASLPLTLRAADVLAEPATRGRRLLLAVLLPGVVVGLATGAKLNGALGGLAFGLGLAAAAAIDGDPAARRRRVASALACGAGAAVVALALFLALDPFYWHDTLGRLLGTRAVYADWMTMQQIEPGPGLFSLEARLAALAHHLALEPRGLAVRLVGSGGGVALLVAAGGGALALARRALGARSGSGGAAHRDAVVALVFAGVVGGAVAGWMPVDWDRYALPVLLPFALLAGIGVGRVPGLVADLRRATAARGWLRGAGPTAAAALGLGAAALCVAADGLPPRRTLLDPSRLGPDVARYRAAVARDPDCPVLQRNLGRALVAHRRFAEAAAALGAALAGPAPPQPPALEAGLRFEQAVALARAGRPGEAGRALEREAAVLGALRERATGGDPFVRAQYDRLLAERRDRLAAAAP